jgi:hypothetical protein
VRLNHARVAIHFLSYLLPDGASNQDCWDMIKK